MIKRLLPLTLLGACAAAQTPVVGGSEQTCNADGLGDLVGKPGTAVRKFEPVPPDAGWPQFNYAGFRDALVHSGRWPEKTRDRSMYACRFERSDWTFSDVLLKLYDLPGERLADAAMLGRDRGAHEAGLTERLERAGGERAVAVVLRRGGPDPRQVLGELVEQDTAGGRHRRVESRCRVLACRP